MDFDPVYFLALRGRRSEKLRQFMKEDLVDEIMQAGPERPPNPVRFEKDRPSPFLFPVARSLRFLACGGGGTNSPLLPRR